MRKLFSDRNWTDAGCKHPKLTHKTQPALLTVFLQQLVTCMLLLLVSIGVGWLGGWSNTALALPSQRPLSGALLAQVDPESNDAKIPFLALCKSIQADLTQTLSSGT